MCLLNNITAIVFFAKQAVMLAAIAIAVIPADAQNTSGCIHGIVADKDHKPVAGVTVSAASGNRTISDADGRFEIMILRGKADTFTFQHVSYSPKSVLLSDNCEGKTYVIRLDFSIVQLPHVSVNGITNVLIPSIDRILKEHQSIAGGTSVAVMQPAVQRLETLKEALRFEPGVIVQEFFGANDQPRINIRGSGLQSNPQRRGVYLLQDGMPVNFSDGSFVIGVMDPMTTQYAEVFKGANALRYGAATLGGAVNFVSRNGVHNKGLLVKLESGSFGYGSLSVMGGGQKGKTDAYLSLSASRQDGFRQHNKNEKLNIAFNTGYRYSAKIENRTYINFSHIQFDIPGPLTLGMIAEDPVQVNQGVDLPYAMGPDILRDKPGRDVTMFRVANKTALQIDSVTQVTAAVYYQYAYDRFAFPIVLSTQRSATYDMGMILQWSRQSGRHKVTSGIIGSYGVIIRKGHINKDGLDSYMFSSDRLTAPNITGYAEYNYMLTNRLQIIANLQVVYNERNSKDVFPDPGLRPWYSHSSHKYRYFRSENISLNQSYKTLNPRIGVVYHADREKQLQLFGNVSASYEPPTFDELIGTQVTENINTSPKRLFAVRLKQQKAFTLEAGTRNVRERYSWSVSLHHSWLWNELLEVKDFVLGIKTTRNYPHTTHSGMEAGLTMIPLQGIFSAQGKDHISLQAMYNYSYFRFSSGAYKGNQLAGVPPHFITVALEYKYQKGLFININMESQPAATYIDHANTLQQPSYTIYGAKAGYLGMKNFSFYVECKNLLNRYYASGYIISDQIHSPAIPFPDFTAHNMAFFVLGTVRAFYAGITYQL